MANPEHLEILRQGVETWNQWRKNNPEIQPDLRRVDVSGADFHGADFHGADLRGADLSEADLSEADLSRVNLRDAILRRANLREANLHEADLRETVVSEVVFCKANLREANLSEAVFCGVNLRDAILYRTTLRGTNLSEADLRGADVREADLRETNLSETDFREANLCGTNLREADLRAADFRYADIRKASLHTAQIIETKLDGANLTDACLWESSRAGWSIKGVTCESVYWDEGMEERTVYSPGDFERLFSEKVRVRLFYKDGISPLEIATLPVLIKHLEESHPECRLRLMHIKEDSGGILVELAIEDAGDQSPEQLKQLKAEIEATSKHAIDLERKFLAEEKQRLRLESRLDEVRYWLREQLLLSTGPVKVHVQGDSYMGDKYNVSGQAGAVGDNANARDMTFNQIVNHFEKSIDLLALANQLEELRQEMAKRQDLSPQAAIALGEAAKAEIEAKKGNTSKVVEYLKAGGQGLLDIVKDAGKEVLTSAIKAAVGIQ